MVSNQEYSFINQLKEVVPKIKEARGAFDEEVGFSWIGYYEEDMDEFFLYLDQAGDFYNNWSYGRGIMDSVL
tara:strand:- start:670 stop:885 length:216 start_codon:yes stop_codon:yes gene_type:complete